MDKVKAVFNFLSKPFEWVVQKVRDYPKATLIAWGVSLLLAKIF